MPLHLRRHKLLLQYSIKLKANIKNPANSVLKNTWENHYGKYKQGAEPVYNITHSFLEKIGNIEQFHISEQPTWHLPLGNTDLSLHKYVSKKDNLEILKSYAIEHISKFTGYTHIYTDGSKLTSGVTGASFFDKTNDEKQCVRLSNNITIYTAELIAIKLAMQWLITKGIVGKVAIFSDSLSAIQSLETGISTSKPNLLLGVRKLLKQINMENRCEITFSWIPSHVGIIGNEMADTLAKLATSKSQVEIDLPREVKDVYFDIDKHIMNTWQEEYNKSKTGTHYNYNNTLQLQQHNTTQLQQHNYNNTFLAFFKDKIERIRTKFSPSDSPDPFLFPPVPPPKLINFIPATLTEIHKLISSSESKQCPLDSIPTFLLKLCFNELGPIITNLVNLSLSEGIFPSSFKQALVQPLLKKPSLSTDDLNNFRPISNLNFISKILEKVVASRIQSHLSSNSLSSSFQSAYRIFHSTETTLLKIHNDLILAMDRGEVTSLILLDLSAAFDTVDHSILLTRLQNWFGLDGLSLDWFTSYLSSRSQAVSINDSISAFSTLSCGVPQGSVLGPLLFTLYTTPLDSVISKNSLKYHLYADDTQLYISFTPSNSALSLDTLTTTFTDILSWMNLNKLLLNPSKTEFLLIGTKQQRLKFSDLTNLSLSNDIIPVSSSARNLGFIFDSDMSFSDQINSVSKSCHFHIRDIRRIRHLLPLSAATALANSLVSSKLDYCNSLYSGISQANLNKLQRIQNSLARVITNTSKYQHITPILKKLHWLPIKQRIDYKLCLLTYKTLTNQQPTYLYNSLSFPSHSVSTRSSDSLVLSIPYVRSSLGKRAFSVIGPRLWNSLPPDTRNSSSLPIFRSRLKTHLFKIAFPP